VKRTFLVVALLAIVAAGALFLVPRTPAQVTLSVEPSMTKGPPDARVTIIEFSDYQ
jgi:hypothetical protein